MITRTSDYFALNGHLSELFIPLHMSDGYSYACLDKSAHHGDNYFIHTLSTRAGQYRVLSSVALHFRNHLSSLVFRLYTLLVFEAKLIPRRSGWRRLVVIMIGGAR